VAAPGERLARVRRQAELVGHRHADRLGADVEPDYAHVIRRRPPRGRAAPPRDRPRTAPPAGTPGCGRRGRAAGRPPPGCPTPSAAPPGPPRPSGGARPPRSCGGTPP